MTLISIIAYLSNSLWVIIPFFKRKSKYFLFFLILGVLSIIGFIGKHTHLVSSYFYLSASFLILCSFYDNPKKKFYMIALIVATLLYFISENLSISTIYIVDSILEIMIMFLFIKDFIKIFIGKQIISIFILALVAYQISTVLKLLAIILDLRFGLEEYYITTAFQILLGIFFIKFTEKSILLSIK